MATTTAPSALYRVFSQVKPYFRTVKMGGVVGDAKHGSGYHLSRNALLARGLRNDYSIQCPADKRGSGNYAAAIDLTFGDLAELVLVTKRLRAACTPNAAGDYDPRIEPIREHIGTLDGRNVCGYNRVPTGSASRSRVGWFGTGFSDSSHLWHAHISVLRDYVDDANRMTGLAEVVAGLKPGALGWKDPSEAATAPVPAPQPPEAPAPTPEPTPAPEPSWDGKSFPGREAFGVGKSGPWITLLGERLVAHGWQGYSVGPGPDFSETDLAAVLDFQKRQGWTGASATGIPGPATWARLMADPPKTPAPKPPSTPAPTPAPPKEEPPVTKPSFEHVVTLDAPGGGAWQGVAQDVDSGDYLVAHSRGSHIGGSAEDVHLYRFNRAGKYLDQMILVDAGHVYGFGFHEGRVWISWDAADGKDVVTLPYKGGRTVRKSAAAKMHVFTELPAQVSFSPSRDGLVVLETLPDGRHRFTKRLRAEVEGNVDNPRGKSITRPKSSDWLQGFSLVDEHLFLLYGKTNGRARVERWSFETGEKTGELDVTAAGPLTGGRTGKREPEGMDGRTFAVKSGEGANRRMMVYRLRDFE